MVFEGLGHIEYRYAEHGWSFGLYFNVHGISN